MPPKRAPQPRALRCWCRPSAPETSELPEPSLDAGAPVSTYGVSATDTNAGLKAEHAEQIATMAARLRALEVDKERISKQAAAKEATILAMKTGHAEEVAGLAEQLRAVQAEKERVRQEAATDGSGISDTKAQQAGQGVMSSSGGPQPSLSPDARTEEGVPPLAPQPAEQPPPVVQRRKRSDTGAWGAIHGSAAAADLASSTAVDAVSGLADSGLQSSITEEVEEEQKEEGAGAEEVEEAAVTQEGAEEEAETEQQEEQEGVGKDKVWADMDELEQHCVQELGWTASSWDAGDETPFQTQWSQLSEDQQSSAETLGLRAVDFPEDAADEEASRVLDADPSAIAATAPDTARELTLMIMPNELVPIARKLRINVSDIASLTQQIAAELEFSTTIQVAPAVEPGLARAATYSSLDQLGEKQKVQVWQQ
jgi:hypothetical protein